MIIYAKTHDYVDLQGNPRVTICSTTTPPDDTWQTFNVPDSSWLYLDINNKIQIQTQAVMTAVENQAALPVLEEGVQAYIDKIAKKKGYDSAASCISYLNSTITAWKTDATAMNVWRDSVWTECQTVENAVAAGTQALPTIDQLIALLPTAPW